MAMLDTKFVFCSDGFLRPQGFCVVSQPEFGKFSAAVYICERHFPGDGAGDIGQL